MQVKYHQTYMTSSSSHPDYSLYFSAAPDWPPKLSKHGVSITNPIYANQLKIAVMDVVTDGSFKQAGGKNVKFELCSNRLLTRRSPPPVDENNNSDSIAARKAAGVEALKIACQYAHVDLCMLLLSQDALRFGLPSPVDASGTNNDNSPLFALFSGATINFQHMFLAPRAAFSDRNPPHIYNDRANVMDHMNENSRSRFTIACELLKNGADVFATRNGDDKLTPLESVERLAYGQRQHININIDKDVKQNAIALAFTRIHDMLLKCIYPGCEFGGGGGGVLPIVYAFVSLPKQDMELVDDLIELAVFEMIKQVNTVSERLKSALDRFDPNGKTATPKRNWLGFQL
jgi:hypothetical protein